MAAAWILTFLALAGIVVGATIGQSRMLSVHLAAAGGGLLAGIGVFWLMPEIAATIRWPGTLGISATVGVGLWLLDRTLLHGHSLRHGLVGPLLTATAVHSFLDGWSVRAVAVQPLASLAVSVGLALHKFPEGMALGWITGRSMRSSGQTILACGAVECVTLLGAWAEPSAYRSGTAAFGSWWTAAVLAVVAGSFLFLGIHAVVPERKKTGVVPVFLGTFALLGLIAWMRVPGAM